MRIGIDVRVLSYEFTGIPIYVSEMIRYWSMDEQEDEFFLYSNKPLKINDLPGDNWHIIIDRHRFGGIWAKTRLRRLLVRDRIDVYWEPMNFLPRRIRGVKYVVTVHDIAVYLNPSYGSFTDSILERAFLPGSCKRADRIVAISESTKKDIVSHFGVTGDKIEVIHNGDSPYTGKERSYSDSQLKECCERWGITPGNYLLFVSTLEPRKNVVTIVKAYDILRSSGRFGGRLVLAGKKGWKSESIFEQIENSPYKEDIIVTGYVSDIDKECFYRNAACFVFPSFYEGFGFPIVEAMSVGLPVVTSDVSSMPEVGGDEAFYIPADRLTEAGCLADAVGRVLEMDEENRKALAMREQKRVERFSRKKCAQKVLECIKNTGN